MNTTSKKGYKFTEEFGLIPNDWEVRNLGEVCKIGHGKDYKNEKFGDIPVFGTGGYMTSINSYLYDGETVCIGRKGTIDKPFYYSGKIWTVDTLFYTYDFQNVLPKYLYYTFCMVNWLSKNEASGVPSLTERIISATNILLPPLPEQEKIAEVLSDVDSLIDKTLGLINKKKDLKTATMQKLLTPKDDWECKTLGECVQVQGGYSFNSEKFTKNGIPIIRISNIYNNGVIIDNETVYYEPFNINKEFIINKGDILIAMSGATTGKVGIYKYGRQSYLNQRVGKFVATNKYIVMQYIEQVLNSNQFINELNKSIAQGAQPNISSKQIEEIQFYFPTKSEQEKIATILSDMDLEIETLQKELGKYQDLKIGIMQQLLTGQVRLLS